MLFLLLAACADLPEGWEDAVPIGDLQQSACAGDPYADEGEGEVRAEAVGERTSFVWGAAHFRCAQDVEGFYREGEGGTLMLLVQPADMHPAQVARCDCLYDISFTVDDPAEAGWELWRRWDALNDPNDPVRVAGSDDPDR